MDNTIEAGTQVYRKQLDRGIAKREEILANPKTQESAVSKVRKQLKLWRKDLINIKTGEFTKHTELIRKSLIGDWEAKRVDIICLKYKEEEIEKDCTRHLIDYTKWPYKLTWYDSRNQTANFSKLWNHLICVSTCDYIVIMDSDAFVSEKWLTSMMACFEPDFECLQGQGSTRLVTSDNVGVVVPRTREGAASTVQGRLGNSKDPRPFLTEEQISGFFFLFKKEVWQDIGAFDERFYLHGQDSEWIDRVIASKWNIVVCPDVFVDHLVSASISKAVKNGEVNYGVDIAYTQFIYDLIRTEKKQGVYAPFRY